MRFEVLDRCSLWMFVSVMISWSVTLKNGKAPRRLGGLCARSMNGSSVRYVSTTTMLLSARARRAARSKDIGIHSISAAARPQQSFVSAGPIAHKSNEGLRLRRSVERVVLLRAADESAPPPLLRAGFRSSSASAVHDVGTQQARDGDRRRHGQSKETSNETRTVHRDHLRDHPRRGPAPSPPCS